MPKIVTFLLILSQYSQIFLKLFFREEIVLVLCMMVDALFSKSLIES